MEFPATYLEHFWLVPNGISFYTIRFSGYMDWKFDIWNFLRLLRPEFKPKRV